MNLHTEYFTIQNKRWPHSGRVILAQSDVDSVVVYQAYRPSIGHYAALHGHFGGEFSMSRMTWTIRLAAGSPSNTTRASWFSRSEICPGMDTRHRRHLGFRRNPKANQGNGANRTTSHTDGDRVFCLRFQHC